jgi:hypothetical protein
MPVYLLCQSSSSSSYSKNNVLRSSELREKMLARGNLCSGRIRGIIIRVLLWTAMRHIRFLVASPCTNSKIMTYGLHTGITVSHQNVIADTRKEDVNFVTRYAARNLQSWSKMQLFDNSVQQMYLCMTGGSHDTRSGDILGCQGCDSEISGVSCDVSSVAILCSSHHGAAVQSPTAGTVRHSRQPGLQATILAALQMIQPRSVTVGHNELQPATAGYIVPSLAQVALISLTDALLLESLISHTSSAAYQTIPLSVGVYLMHDADADNDTDTER